MTQLLPNASLRDRAEILKREPHLGLMSIGGQLVESSNGWIECTNPANDTCIGRVPNGTPEDVDKAVLAAESAQVSWAELPVARRAQCMNAFADAIAAHSDELLLLEVADSGNSITGMRGDIASGVERIRYFAGLGYELQGTTIPGDSDRLNLTLREPYGVVGRIAAFNHPLTMIVNGLASALMAGNTVVAKPSEQCPLSATLLGEIANAVFVHLHICFQLNQQCYSKRPNCVSSLRGLKISLGLGVHDHR